jgi:Fur family ferric uptake transcriptional regulator
MKAKPNPSGYRSGLTPGALPMLALAEMRLRGATVRVTAARVKVLSALLNARCACSHQDMQDRFIDMNRVTLYRAFDCLTEAGLVHKIAGDDRVFRYSVGTEHSAHPSLLPHQGQHGHFKCTRCTKVFCLDHDASAGGGLNASRTQAAIRRQWQDALQETLGKGFQSHNIELTIKGWCADCAH